MKTAQKKPEPGRRGPGALRPVGGASDMLGQADRENLAWIGGGPRPFGGASAGVTGVSAVAGRLCENPFSASPEVLSVPSPKRNTSKTVAGSEWETQTGAAAPCRPQTMALLSSGHHDESRSKRPRGRRMAWPTGGAQPQAKRQSPDGCLRQPRSTPRLTPNGGARAVAPSKVSACRKRHLRALRRASAPGPRLTDLRPPASGLDATEAQNPALGQLGPRRRAAPPMQAQATGDSSIMPSSVPSTLPIQTTGAAWPPLRAAPLVAPCGGGTGRATKALKLAWSVRTVGAFGETGVTPLG